ncbi:hypothetical protein G4H71_17220 [Rhodococcus triatomae]|nr:hypothetical protein G4H72_13155 [Rhodococcus triatomae]QNG25837.1 hypothetical protein G4H71_17220 [Rhodococcus triatomae]
MVIAVVGATVVNLVVWALGHLVGASFEIQDGGAVHTVDAMGVASSSAVPMAVGIGLAALLSLWKAWPLRVAQAVGAVFALATIAGSVSADTDGATMAALSVMHVVVALFVVGTLELLHRRVSEPAEQ